MANYEFGKDLKLGQEAEQDVITRLRRRIPSFQLIETNHDFSHDIRARVWGRECLFEVKYDLMSQQTGNIAIEFQSRGKWSDIAISNAQMWVFKYFRKGGSVPQYRCVQLETLKAAWKSLQYRTVVGGDKGSNTKMFLVPIEDFETWGLLL